MNVYMYRILIYQVIDETLVTDDAGTLNPGNLAMPLLVYVAREKRPTHHPHFKAGALNTLVLIHFHKN